MYSHIVLPLKVFELHIPKNSQPKIYTNVVLYTYRTNMYQHHMFELHHHDPLALGDILDYNARDSSLCL